MLLYTVHKLRFPINQLYFSIVAPNNDIITETNEKMVSSNRSLRTKRKIH